MLGKFRNHIETNIDAGTTVFTDHQPSLYKNSLSNKGQLSEWRISEVADLQAAVQTLYCPGPKLTLSDGLSRMCTPVSGLYDQSLPTKIAILLSKLPQSIQNAGRIHVHTNSDTVAIFKLLQK